MNPSFSINGRIIGYEYDPLIIAEIGINHEGSLDIAIEMVDAAASSGAEIIKHQTHIVEDEMSEEAKLVIPGNADVSIYEIMERCSLSEREERVLKDYVEKLGLIFISTPFSRAAAFRLRDMDIPAYKIGSGECNNYPLIKLLASFGKPLIVSTGMNDLQSISKTVEIIRKAGVPFALLHCTNIYPTPYRDVRLGGMQQLSELFPDAVIGLSDHTVDNFACLGAVALGASILERHFTDSKLRPGPDIVCSMDPEQFVELKKGSLALAEARGGSKGPIEGELPTIRFAISSVVVVKDLIPGDILTEDVLWMRRPGNGDFGPDDYDSLLGKKVLTSISKGEQLRISSIEGYLSKKQ